MWDGNEATRWNRPEAVFHPADFLTPDWLAEPDSEFLDYQSAPACREKVPQFVDHNQEVKNQNHFEADEDKFQKIKKHNIGPNHPLIPKKINRSPAVPTNRELIYPYQVKPDRASLFTNPRYREKSIPMKPPLALIEEIVLLSLDDETGAHLPLPPFALGLGMAGALLDDLSMAGRICTDGPQVKVLNAETTGNPLLDPWLALIAKDSQEHSVHYWLSILANEKKEIESEALAHLIERGILKREDKKILWVLGLRRYPTIHNEERGEVRTRLERLILSDDPPSHFDATLISLLDGCELLHAIFRGDQYEARSARVASIAASDPVGREVAEALRELLSTVLLAQTATSNPF